MPGFGGRGLRKAVARRILAQKKEKLRTYVEAKTRRDSELKTFKLLKRLEFAASGNVIFAQQRHQGARQYSEDSAKLQERLARAWRARAEKRPRATKWRTSQDGINSVFGRLLQDDVDANVEIFLKEVVEVALRLGRHRLSHNIVRDALRFNAEWWRRLSRVCGASPVTQQQGVPFMMRARKCSEEEMLLPDEGTREVETSALELDAMSLDATPQPLSHPLLSSEERESLAEHIQNVDSPAYSSTPLVRKPGDELLLPFFAQMLDRQVHSAIAIGPPSQLRCLLRRLQEVDDVAFTVGCKADSCIRHCMMSTTLLCLSPKLGARAAADAESCCRGIRRDAAALLSRMALRRKDRFPNLAAEVCKTCQEAILLSSMPTARSNAASEVDPDSVQQTSAFAVMSGAVWCLAFMGAASIECKLMPALQQSRVAASLAGTTMVAAQDNAGIAAALRGAADVMLLDALRAGSSLAAASKLHVAESLSAKATCVAQSDPASWLATLQVPRGFIQGPGYGKGAIDPIAFCL